MKFIPLSRGLVAIIDDGDYEFVSQHKWYANARGYAVRDVWNGGNKKTLFMHREIIQCPDDMECDHVDGDRLNNTRENLRVCTPKQNSRNNLLRKDSRSGFKGVGIGSKGKYRWFYAYIVVNRKRIHLGNFKDNPVEAARAYDKAAIRYFGEFAKTNFPRQDYVQADRIETV